MILNADDLGLSLPVNQAIHRAVGERWATSTSLMATGPAFEDAVRGLRGLDACVGVHLDLSEGRPVTGAVRGLCSGGAFRPQAFREVASHHDAVVSEWLAQIARVRDAGIVPTHLDSHMHVHWHADVARVLRDVVLRSGIRRVRRMGRWRLGVGAARRWRQQLRAWNFNRSLATWSSGPEAFCNARVFRQLVTSAHLPSSVEVLLHPGADGAEFPSSELHALRVQTGRFELIAWRDVS